jgi:hypothetical protein
VDLQSADQQTTTAEAGERMGTPFPKAVNERLLPIYPCLADQLQDHLPSAETLILLAQRNIGENITNMNVESVRAEVENIADLKTYRRRQIVLQDIGRSLPPGTSMGDPAFVNAIIAEYEPALSGITNAGVALAGRVHELILLESLSSVGLVRGEDFEKPSNPNQNGDYLATEVKSLKSRERFARGLGQIGGRKVGAGFFDDASEFTASLTQSLIGLSTAAVYMPETTIGALQPQVRSALNAAQAPFYRPITSYASDMREFVLRGRIP